MGGNHGAFFNDRTVQNHRAHANQTTILNGAGVNDGTMTNGHIIANGGEGAARGDMNDTQVLNVGAPLQ